MAAVWSAFLCQKQPHSSVVQSALRLACESLAASGHMLVEGTDLLTTNATSSTSSLLSQDPSSTTSNAGSEVVASVGAVVLAVVVLTWVFAEL